MSQKSEVFSSSESSDLRSNSSPLQSTLAYERTRDWVEIAIVFALILAAVWTPVGRPNAFFVVAAVLCVLGFAVAGRWSASELGLTRPLAGVRYIVLVGALLCGAVVLIGIPLRFAGDGYRLPLSQSLLYMAWSLAQQFILQCLFFVRLESLLGSRRAVVAAAGLFTVVHLPSPLLTFLSFCGGMLFCELFRRWRNLYPLGIIHGALGLTIATSLPDQWLHHMRVGIGYLRFH
jgi:hypothetical protein